MFLRKCDTLFPTTITPPPLQGQVTLEASILARGLITRYVAGSTLPGHHHRWGQLVYASTGAVRVQTQAGPWMLPPDRVLWLPAQCAHGIDVLRTAVLHCLYVPLPAAAQLPPHATFVGAPLLLRELLVLAVAQAPLVATSAKHVHLLGLLLALLGPAEHQVAELAMPADARARRAAHAWLAAPAHDSATVARQAGASVRTLERLFLAETGLTLSTWRRRVRLSTAVQLLALGAGIAAAAEEVGYRSESAFAAAFKQAFGTSPARYQRAQLARQ